MDIVLTVAGLGALLKKLIDVVRGSLDPGAAWPKPLWGLLALAGGVGLCLGWQVNVMPEALGEVSRLTGIAGQAITGLLVAGAAGIWHDVVDAYSVGARKPVVPSVKVK